MKTKEPDVPVTTDEFRLLPLEQIELDPNNVRQTLDKAKLKELAESIAQHGVLQPILVRPHEGAADSLIRFRLIAGERRFRAAQMAGLTEIPALIRTLDPAEEGADLQIIENLQREDVHPLEEALGFQRMKDGLHLDVKSLARRLGKDARYIARRLALVDLIPQAKQDFRREKITLAHALELCILSPEIQEAALAICYEVKSEWSEEQQESVFVPDKDRPSRHVRYLQEWIVQHVHFNLAQAPFPLDDPNLRADQLTCVACPQRSGYNKTLFADIKDKDICLNPTCYQGKLHTFLQQQKMALEAKHGEPVMYLSTSYRQRYDTAEVLTRDEYRLLPKRADRCRFAEPAVWIDGPAVGHTQWICREDACKIHRSHSISSQATHGSTSATTVDRSQRKQEIFDLKVAEEVRLRVMKEALPTYTWPLTRPQLLLIALEFFERIPHPDRKTIRKVLGQEEEPESRFHYDRESLQQRLSALTDEELAQFLMLCSFAHYGANPARVHTVDQSAVIALSKERGVNYQLIDAQVRLERCPKKYRERHQDYLALVKLGQPAPKPWVCEQAPPANPPESAPLSLHATA